MSALSEDGVMTAVTVLGLYLLRKPFFGGGGPVYYVCHSDTGISGLREVVFAFRVLSCTVIFTPVVWRTRTRIHC